MPFRTVAHVGPALEEDSPRGAVFVDHVEPAFQAHEIAPALALFGGEMDQSFGALPRALHQFFAVRRGMADAALHVESDNLKLGAGIEHGSDSLESITDRVEFRTAGAANGDDNFVHKRRERITGKF